MAVNRKNFSVKNDGTIVLGESKGHLRKFAIELLFIGAVLFGGVKLFDILIAGDGLASTDAADAYEAESLSVSSLAPETETPEPVGFSDDILPSDKRLITEEDIQDMPREEVRLAVNEIYARHGRYYSGDYLREAFNVREWYNPDPSLSDEEIYSRFSEIESANLDFLVKYEMEKGWR
ncbi:MAG: YARHG domain-containing protein [Clostridiales bacterium]|nr:YARHG domain-containing protein [Clostridiales bacterium]